MKDRYNILFNAAFPAQLAGKENKYKSELKSV